MQQSFGTTTVNSIEYSLTTQADFTGRLLPYCQDNFHQVADGETYRFEMSAGATSPDGASGVIYWIFDAIKGNADELDNYNFNVGDRFEEN